MTYPDGIDALVNVNANDSLAAGGHAARHNSVNTALVEIKNMLGPSPAGKIMQIVRATDSTNRSTTSTSFVDANLSVTITPQKNNSAIIVVVSVRAAYGNGGTYVQITDNSNNAISGAEFFVAQDLDTSGSALQQLTGFAYSTPGTTNATTYKTRFRSSAADHTSSFENAGNTGQMYAIEVSA
jgi:hypothetical protein